jgi:hypothetical protein
VTPSRLKKATALALLPAAYLLHLKRRNFSSVFLLLLVAFSYRIGSLYLGLLFLADLFFLSISWLLAYWLRFRLPIIPITKGIPPFTDYAVFLFGVYITWWPVFHYTRLDETSLASAVALFELLFGIKKGLRSTWGRLELADPEK